LRVPGQGYDDRDTTQQAALITVVDAIGTPSLSQVASALSTTHQNAKQIAAALERKGFMTRSGAAVGSFVFAVGQPGVMGFLVPYWITGGWDGSGAPLAQQVAGAALLAAGVGVLAHTVIRFAIEGLGTPFPAAPTENLVVGGLYRYVRNPMYLAVIASILGQAAILGRASLLVYAAILWVTVATFVRFYEEPTLSMEYGEQYAAYRRAVRGWWPRATPWRG
jgi:protein-S-isoprenylcysteine O-methyltransferase Ste14